MTLGGCGERMAGGVAAGLQMETAPVRHDGAGLIPGEQKLGAWDSAFSLTGCLHSGSRKLRRGKGRWMDLVP